MLQTNCNKRREALCDLSINRGDIFLIQGPPTTKTGKKDHLYRNSLDSEESTGSNSGSGIEKYHIDILVRAASKRFNITPRSVRQSLRKRQDYLKNNRPEKLLRRASIGTGLFKGDSSLRGTARASSAA